MIALTNLTMDEFMHPKDRAAWIIVEEAPWLKKMMDWALTKGALYQVATDLLGRSIWISEDEEEWLHDMIKDVCRILDYEPVPQVFTDRMASTDIKIIAGGEPVLIYPSLLFNVFDRDMIRFQTGRAITMLKAGNIELRLAVMGSLQAISQIPGVGLAAVPILADWIRKSRYTEDRGGLLACQNMDVAISALLCRAGIPLKYVNPKVLPQYLRIYQKPNMVTRVAQSGQTLYREEPWVNDRLVELFQWHSSGEYDDLLEEYE